MGATRSSADSSHNPAIAPIWVHQRREQNRRLRRSHAISDSHPVYSRLETRPIQRSALSVGAPVSLDLDCFTADWPVPSGGVCARLIRDGGGGEHVQMRIEMGILQMAPAGRPDGSRHHGHPTVLEHIRHELRIAAAISAGDWEALEREFQQFNYRRLAYAALAELAIQTDEAARAIDLLQRTIHDIEHCVATLRTMRTAIEGGIGRHAPMLPALLFN